MKKAALLLAGLLLIASLTACGGKNDNKVDEQLSQAEEQANTNSIESNSGEATWPKEFEAWGVPTIDGANITLTDNRSIENGMLTQGVNIIVNLSELSKEDFNTYCHELEKTGFVKNENSMDEIMIVYNKTVDGGEIEITISYSEDTTTIVVNNSAVASQQVANVGASAEWPDCAKGIPEFTKGTYKETVSMGGTMYAITFTEVDDADLNWYRGELKKAGFEKQDSEDTEGYAKLDTDAAYSVGFVYENGTLQIIVMTETY